MGSTLVNAFWLQEVESPRAAAIVTLDAKAATGIFQPSRDEQSLATFQERPARQRLEREPREYSRSAGEAASVRLGGVSNGTSVSPGAELSAELVRAVQRELAARNYEPGPIDGVPGIATRAAVIAFQADAGLATTAQISDSLLQSIVLGASTTALPAPDDDGRLVAEIVKFVQRELASLGYGVAEKSGRLDRATRDAIRAFERDQGLAQTGRVSGRLVLALERRRS